MRLFAAVIPPEAVVDDLDAAVGEPRPATDVLRWTPTGRWHLTVAFYGEVDEARLGDLEGRLTRVAARHDRLELAFRGGGAFARPDAATVVWVGVDGPRRQLSRLADSCGAAGRRIGLQLSDRAYRPHLTLARSRSGRPIDVRDVVARLDGYAGPSWTASALHLVRSHLGPRPRYETLASFALGGATTNEDADYQA